MSKKQYTIEDLKQIMATLRGPNGCPWDKKQDHKSLTPFAIEEAHELEDAIYNKTDKDVLEELGDLLFQVVFQAQMYSEQNKFNFDDVVDHLSRKMTERHPHVFQTPNTGLNAQEVLNTWEEKKSEKQDGQALFDIPKNFPALLTAAKIGKKTKVIHFDWHEHQGVYQQAQSEIAELEEAMAKMDLQNIEEEIGDVLFTLAQLARHFNMDPEKALRLSNDKVVQRILKAHEISGLSWPDFCALSVEDKEKLWQQSKRN